MFGALAGAASVFGNTPLDVVKTRMQVRHHGTKMPRAHCSHQSVPPDSLQLCIAPKSLLDALTPASDPSFSSPQGLEAHKYKSTWDCAYQIMKYEGPLA